MAYTNGFLTGLGIHLFLWEDCFLGHVSLKYSRFLYEVKKERLIWRPCPSVRDLVIATTPFVGFS
jgi:hypothetical protein